jgi:hypothetical protein
MGAWQQIAPLPNKLERACAVYHPDADKVYVFGGWNQETGGVANRTTYILDPDTNTWSTGALMPAAVIGGGAGLSSAANFAFVAPDGLVHVLGAAGGHYRYDPDANTWDTRAGNTVLRQAALAFQDSSGRIILAGGTVYGSGATPSYAVERYDPATNTWTSLADIPIGTEQQFNTVGVLGDDGKFYSGYSTFCDDLVTYDPAGPTWARTPTFPVDGAVPGGYNVPVSRLPNGTILRLANNQGATRVKRIDGYNPTTGLWTMGVIPDFIGPVYDFAAIATDLTGRIWVIGGEDNYGSPSTNNSKTEAYVYLQNRPPTAATLLTLTGGVLVNTAIKNRARHQFNDPDAGDSQSKFDWRHRILGDPSWVTGTATNPNPWYDIDAGTLDPGDYERQVRTYDATGEAAPWTASGFFTAADPPAGPTITYPVNGQELEQQERIDWSAAAQDSYQVRRVADDAGEPDASEVYFDTGEVVDALTRTLALEFETNGRTEHVQVRVKDGGLWSDWVSVSGDVSYTPPPTPEVTLYVDQGNASLLLMIVTAAPEGDDPPAVYVDVWIDDGAGEERKATQLPINGAWRYWTPVSGRDYATAVRVVAVSANGTTSSSS